MVFNRIAVYGHRGWASSAIVRALASSGAFIKVLYRPGSDISTLPNNVTTVEVDVEDQYALVGALKGIDIVISLVGHEGVSRQHHLVTAITKSDVQLFVPSDLAARYDEQGMRIPVNHAKGTVETAAKEAGIATTVVLPGNFAEFALSTGAMGVDYKQNRFIYTGESAIKPLNLCTKAYVAAAYASIFASTPIEKIKNRTLALCELSPTGDDIVAALTEKFGSRTLTTAETIESINDKVETALSTGNPFALAYYCRKIWGSGQQAAMVGTDMWDLEQYPKASLRGLIVDGQLGSYRGLPVEVEQFFASHFELCT
ncbi:NAD(P)-binding protein [Aspergillus sclerotioniger CBS 115572]|uniref:NAD(P)-binding protein n=1 Tax=Aspergillus sclerotioniger CBS 115572 TaxID=1450535 RepID=A0A317W4P9_9EURO|nr:NAD(P)-binding protein [Aspergillus sclerotioniger CBS 115572]PWY81596.1 NAD(P)-binding protein [Aspergillus sclerotioniger CBS 115572]